MLFKFDLDLKHSSQINTPTPNGTLFYDSVPHQMEIRWRISILHPYLVHGQHSGTW